MNALNHKKKPLRTHRGDKTMPKTLWTATAVLISVACGGGIPFGMVQFGQLNVEGSVDAHYLERQLAPLDPIFEAWSCHLDTLASL